MAILINISLKKIIYLSNLLQEILNTYSISSLILARVDRKNENSLMNEHLINDLCIIRVCLKSQELEL